MEMSPIVIISLIISLLLLFSWLKTASNVKQIMQKILGAETIEFCKSEAEIYAFSGNSQEALKWYYRALYYESKGLSDYSSESARNNRINTLKEEYLKVIEELGGKWPPGLNTF